LFEVESVAAVAEGEREVGGPLAWVVEAAWRDQELLFEFLELVEPGGEVVVVLAAAAAVWAWTAAEQSARLVEQLAASGVVEQVVAALADSVGAAAAVVADGLTVEVAAAKEDGDRVFCGALAAAEAVLALPQQFSAVDRFFCCHDREQLGEIDLCPADPAAH
jgi:hypothetical protein